MKESLCFMLACEEEADGVLIDYESTGRNVVLNSHHVHCACWDSGKYVWIEGCTFHPWEGAS